MTLDERRDVLWAERQRVKDIIDAAYWQFTRQARALPPSMVVPEAFEELRRINDELHEIAIAMREHL